MTLATAIRPAVDPADRYRALLDAGDAAGDAAHFVERQRTGGLFYRGRPACGTIQPRFLAAADYRRLCAAAETGAGLIAKADAAFRASPALRDAVFGAHPLRPVLEAHADYLPEPCGRFDTLVDRSGTAMFIEYNAGLCGGLYFAEALAAAFDDVPAMQALRREIPMAFQPTQRAFAAALVDAYARHFGRPLATAAFILPDGAAGDPWDDHAEIRMMRAEIARLGVEARVVRLHEVRFEGAGIAVGDWHADAAMVLDWLAMTAQPYGAPLLAPRTTQGCWIVNSLGAAIYRSGKHLFALMSDPAIDLAPDRAERDWIARHLPWTRLLRDGPTTDFAGAPADLFALLERDRDELVLKPCFAMGARGVVLGWQCDPAAWAAAIAHARTEPYIVQRRVPLDPGVYACPAPDGIVDRGLESDLCCYIWHGRTAYGLHSRASDSGFTNISGGGGSVVPVFVTEDGDDEG